MAKVKKKVMKKNLFVAAAMMVAMTACVKEADVNVDVEENVPQTEEKVWVEFSTDAVTKAALQEGVGEHQIVWEEGDEISINGYTFEVKEIKEEGLKATIGAFVPADFSAPYRAVYPASAGTSFDELIVNEKPAVVAGGFDDIVSVAYSDDTSLQFKHVTSLFKFQVPSGFAVNTVTISADEALAGNVSVEMADEESTPAITVKNAEKEVTLTGTFTPGQNYYVAVLPGTKTNLTVRLNGYLSKAWANQVNVTTGMVANMKTLPAPVKSSWGVIGLNGDWDNDVAMYNDVNGLSVVKGLNIQSTDEFKFRVGNWAQEVSGGLTAPDTKRANNTTIKSNITVSTEGTYDLYTDGSYYYIMTPGELPSAATAPAAITITIKSNDTSYKCLHMWGAVAVNCKYSANSTWTVTVPKENLDEKVKVILTKGTGDAQWTNQTDDSDDLCMRNPMVLKVVDNKATHK